MANVSAPIWKPRGKYAVKATWTSRFRQQLDAWAKNPVGTSCVLSSLVILYPDNDNAADDNAILVTTLESPPKLLGYLPREQAACYRRRMKEAGYDHMISACEATLTGGLEMAERSYDYILELDLDMSEDPHPEHLVVNPQTVRRPAIPEFKPDNQGYIASSVGCPTMLLGSCTRKVEQ